MNQEMNLKQGILRDKLESYDNKKLNISAAHRQKAQKEHDEIRNRIERAFRNNDRYLRNDL